MDEFDRHFLFVLFLAVDTIVVIVASVISDNYIVLGLSILSLVVIWIASGKEIKWVKNKIKELDDEDSKR